MSKLFGAAEEARRGVGGVTGGPVSGPTPNPTPDNPTPTPDNPGPVDPGSGNILPISSVALWKSYGVQGNPTRQDQPYAGTATGALSTDNIDRWVALYEDMGAAYVRMKYGRNAGTRRAILRLRAAGMKALCPITAEGPAATSSTEAEIRADVRDIRDNAADVVIGIEGVNEPNHNRSSPNVPPPPIVGNWAAITVNVQRWISEEVLASPTLAANVLRVGTSLHDNAASESYNVARTLATRAGCTVAQITPKGYVATQGALPTTNRQVGDTWYINDGTERNFTWTGTAWTAPAAWGGGVKHFHQLVREGILENLIDISGQHTYPGPGDTPLGGRDGGWAGRIHTMWDGYGDGFPVWNTEWGYSTPPASRSGHATAMEPAAATYGPRALLEFYHGYNLRQRIDRGASLLTRFEGVDEWDATRASAEHWFGLWAVDSGGSLAASYNNATWRAKPEVAKMRTILNFLKPANGWAANYTPPRMDLTVNLGTSTDVRWQVVGKPDGTCWLFYWRNQQVQQNITGTPKALINVPAVTFRYTDSTGTRTITNADGEVRWVQVFR